MPSFSLYKILFVIVKSAWSISSFLIILIFSINSFFTVSPKTNLSIHNFIRTNVPLLFNNIIAHFLCRWLRNFWLFSTVIGLNYLMFNFIKNGIIKSRGWLKSLRKFVEKKSFTQKSLAEKLGISQSYLCELESKKSIPSLNTIKKLSNVLEICPIRIINFYEEDELEFNCCIKCYEKECK